MLLVDGCYHQLCCLFSQLDIPSLRVKLADFGLSRPVECVASKLSLFHARWTAPEVWHEYIEEEIWEGKKLNLSKAQFNHCWSNRNTRNIAVMVKMSILRSWYAMSVWLVFFISSSPGIFSRPNQLTQCCTQLKSTGVKIFCVFYLHYNVAFTFKLYGNS